MTLFQQKLTNRNYDELLINSLVDFGNDDFGQTEPHTANKVLPKAGLNGFDWTFVQGSKFVLRLNIGAKNSPPSAIPET